MAPFLILLSAIIVPFADIFLRSFGFWIFLPDLKILFAASLPLFVPVWIALVFLVLTGSIADVFLLRYALLSPLALVLIAFASRILTRRWFSLLVPRSRFLFSLAVSFLGACFMLIMDLVEARLGAASSLLGLRPSPLWFISIFVNAVFIFLSVSFVVRLRSARRLEVKSKFKPS